MLVAEGRPDGAGFQAAAVLAKAGVPVTVVLDSAVGYHMEVADLCVTGAEGVLENGGIVNKVCLIAWYIAFCEDTSYTPPTTPDWFAGVSRARAS